MPKYLTDDEITDFRFEICEVAMRQFAKDGYDKVTMRSITDELGCSRMKPYRYFADKSAILAAVRTEGFRTFINIVESILSTKQKPVTKMRQLAENYFQFAVQRNDLYNLMFTVQQQEEEQKFPELEFELKRLQETFAKASALAVEAGVMNVDPRLASQIFWAGMHGVVSLHLSNCLKLGWSFEELSKEVVNTLFKGLTS